MMPDPEPEQLTCPFCGFKWHAEEEHVMLQHIELDHSESNSPPVPESSAKEQIETEQRDGGRAEPSRSRSQRIRPSREEDYDRRRRTQHSRSTVRSSSSQPSVIQAWKELFNYGSRSSSREGSGHAQDGKRVRHKSKMDGRIREEYVKGRSSGSASRERGESSTSQDRTKLGKSELGRHYNEKHMPNWLVALLADNQGVCGKRIIPVLRQLLDLSPSTQYAYLASPLTQHVSKLRGEGSFCGYRNIQMLISYIIASGIPGAQRFGDSFPNIFQIQDLIEDAWDSGYNAQGRVETGGIRGTRKYIGTPEAQALFCSLNIACPVQAFKDNSDKARARAMLMRAVETYFKQGVDASADGSEEGKVRMTDLPPIYLQHRGHSLTIVGLEKQRDKGPNLLVFDPSFRDPGGVKDLVDETVKLPKNKVGGLLEAYRRGARYFRKYGEFELLYLANPAPQVEF